MFGENKVSVREDYLKSIEQKVEDLKTLMEVSAIISSTLDFNDLMTIVMEKAKDVMDAEASSILLYNRKTNELEFEVALSNEASTSDILKKKVTLNLGQGIGGWVAENLKPLIIKDVQSDNRFCSRADKKTGFTTRSIIAVPLSGRNGLLGVAEIMNPKKKVFFTDYDLNIFQALCRQVAIAIENSIFHKESIEREKIKQELELASALQKSFLPESPVFKKDNIIVSAVNISAKQVGGDLYDFIEPVHGKAGVFIGDISGKGVSAALYMAKIISDLRYIAHLVESPDIVLNRLNSLLSRAPRGIFLTAIYMIVDTVTGNLDISVAGHPPFLWLTKSGVRVMDVEAGPPIGILSEDYPKTDISIEKGDRLILLTDGAFEARNKLGQMIGFEKLVLFIKEHMHEEQLLKMICDYVDSFIGDMERTDDLTLVELRF
jgi:sigma-B regulation protein RsbU (phosphoserine phosphatase)